jgi:uncharacterized protein with FMN-binding domain
MSPHPALHAAPLALLAGFGATLGGCGDGDHKIQRSSKPAAITVPATPAATPGAKAKTRPSGVFTGTDVVTKFGDVQVSLTLERGRITDVQWVKLPLDRPRSRYISQTASPILRSEVLAAQSARIDSLSGATYTSDAWANSVQSALTQVH